MPDETKPETKKPETADPKAGRTLTVVKNNLEALQVMQLPPVGKDFNGHARLGGQVILIPGINLVPTEDLNTLLENPSIADRFTEKIALGMAPEHNREKTGHAYLEKGKTLPMKHPLGGLGEEEAKSLIKETLSDDLLRGWQREEIRPDVRGAITLQIEANSAGGNQNVASVGR